MNRITFSKLEVENFLSFKTKQEIQFQSSGIHIITGENHDLQRDSFDDELTPVNGSGKSSLLSAIDFVLYGDNPNKKIKLENLVNKSVGKNLFTAIEFFKNDELYRIERYRKSTKKGNALLFFIKKGNEWENITLADTKFTQEKIESIIGINHDTFLKAVFLSKEGPRSFIEMPWHERSSLLESIVKLDKLNDYVKKAKEKLSEDKKLLSENRVKATSALSSSVTLNKVVKNAIAREKQNKADRFAKIESLQKELQELTGGADPSLFVRSSKDLYDLYSEKMDILIFSEKLEKEMSSISSSIASLQKKSETLSKDIEKLQQSINKESHSKDRLCQHCGKEPNDYHKKLIDQYSSSIEEKTKMIKENDREIAYLNFQLSEKKLLEKSTAEVDEKIKAIDLPPLLKNGIKKAVVKKEEFKNDKFINDVKEKMTEIEFIKAHKIDVTSIKENLKEFYEVKKEIREIKKEEDFLKNRIDIGHFWDSALDFRNEGSLKNYVMAKIVPIFNNILDSMVNIIFDGTLSITFDNSWKETIIYNGHDYDYGNLSLGEKTKINICISLALYSLLRINVSEFSCLFMDEMFSSVDAVTINKFISIFKASISSDTALHVVSHEAGWSAFTPDSTIRVIKKDGESRIFS